MVVNQNKPRKDEWDLQKDSREYDGDGYNSLPRLHSYAAQVNYALQADPGTVLEIGVGSGIVAARLKTRGIAVSTVDIDPQLAPTFVRSVTDLDDNVPEHDVVNCCQVLEHLEWKLFAKSVASLWRRTRQRLILSLPDVSPYLRFCFHTHRRRLKIGERVWSPFPNSKNGDVYCDEHYWEIGAKKSFKEVIQAIHAATNRKPVVIRLFQNPYHRFFLVDRQN